MLHDQNFTNAAKEDFENPDSFSSIYSLLLQFLIGTIAALLIIKLNLSILLRIFFVVIVSLNTIVVSNLILSDITPHSEIISAVVGLASLILLFVYPTWYVISFVGILVCSNASGLLGSFISPLPVSILLMVLILVDHFAVNVSKYMLTLADTTAKHSIPLAFQIPSYNPVESDLEIPAHHQNITFDKSIEHEAESHQHIRFLGFGDAVFPAMLAVSANVFIGGIAGVLTIIGTLIGGVYLAKEGLKGKPLPGLPYLNTGAICGLAVGVLHYWIF